MILDKSYPIIDIDKKTGKIFSLMTWHKINGEYFFIVQDYENNKFYTNGKEEK